MKTMKPVLYIFIVLFVCVSMFLPVTASAAPSITSPVNGSTLSGSTETFNWTAGGTAVSEWWLWVGTSPGGEDILNSGSLGLNTTYTVSGLPTDGSQVYVRLHYNSGGWLSADFQYTAYNSSIGTPEITSPVNGSTLSGSTETFTWTDNGTAVSEWWLWVGTSPGGEDILNSGSLGLNTTYTVSGLPTDGSQVYVRLHYNSGGWLSADFQYTAYSQGVGSLWQQNGSDIYYNAGRVGIGTASPKKNLHVNGDYYGKGHIFLYSYSGDGTSGLAYLQARDDSGTSDIGLQLRVQKAGSVVDAVRINSNGNVGIGTNGPSSKLDVSTNNGNAITGETSDGFGVVGISTGSSSMYAGGVGGYFKSTNGLGTALYAVNTSSIAGIGVFGKADPINGQAGYFEGRVYIDYRLGINTKQPVFTLDVNGTTRTNALVIGGGSDIAEPFKVGDSINIKPGMVVSIDSEQPGQVRIADSAYDRTVAGIVSGANGLKTGLTMSQEGTIADGTLPVALTGRVYAWADASKGAIKAGDLLTTSDTPGHAMKVSDYEKGHGAVLGKAMTELKQGKGLVLVLISLQ